MESTASIVAKVADIASEERRALVSREVVAIAVSAQSLRKRAEALVVVYWRIPAIAEKTLTSSVEITVVAQSSEAAQVRGVGASTKTTAPTEK